MQGWAKFLAGGCKSYQDNYVIFFIFAVRKNLFTSSRTLVIDISPVAPAASGCPPPPKNSAIYITSVSLDISDS